MRIRSFFDRFPARSTVCLPDACRIVQVGETIIVPLIDVTCGMAAGAFAEGGKQKQRGGGGMSAKMSPSAVLVIQGGVTKLVNVKNQDAVTKVIDMAPDLINKFLGGRPPISEETVQAARDTAAAYDKGPEQMDAQ